MRDDPDAGGDADLGRVRRDRYEEVFRGKRADRIKILWWDGTGLCLYAKRLERGRFVWPLTQQGAVVLTPAQLSMLCEGIDWRSPLRTDGLRQAG
ncbi:MAG: IS66 family insertion sequence element accessory protein TnpB [Xanthobacteraceae bacterium]